MVLLVFSVERLVRQVLWLLRACLFLVAIRSVAAQWLRGLSWSGPCQKVLLVHVRYTRVCLSLLDDCHVLVSSLDSVSLSPPVGVSYHTHHPGGRATSEPATALGVCALAWACVLVCGALAYRSPYLTCCCAATDSASSMSVHVVLLSRSTVTGRPSLAWHVPNRHEQSPALHFAVV